MSTIHTTDPSWHPGERSMHRLMSAPTVYNPTTPYLNPSSANKVLTSPMQVVGTLDRQGRPWTSIWGGPPGFARPLRIQKGAESLSALGMRCLVDGAWDPVLGAMEGRDGEGGWERKGEGEEGGGDQGEAKGKGRLVSGLAINLESRLRAKWAGTVVGVVADRKVEEGENAGTARDVQMVVQIDASLGNCPKYLNKKEVTATIPAPELVPQTPTLPQEALDLIVSSDCLFLTSSNAGTSLSTNYRGGPKGFIRVLPSTTIIHPTTPPHDIPNPLAFSPSSPNISSSADPPIRLIYPEYSGNRYYQTLGNLLTTPLAGLAIPSLSTGTVLYATCTTQILPGSSAAALLPRSNLAVVLTLTSWRLVRHSLGFTATDIPQGMSPYNPTIRYAKGESAPPGSTSHNDKTPLATATIVGKEMLADDVGRVEFETDRPVHWSRGQHVALSFAGELDTGYSHMRDEDPRSLNEDWVRTFTVTSRAPVEDPDSVVGESGAGTVVPGSGKVARRFCVTIRNVGPCTRLLVRANPRAGVEVPVLGFGGEFEIGGGEEGKVVFVAGGIGITPLVAQVGELKSAGKGVVLVWGVRRGDLGLVKGLLGGWRKDGVNIDARVRVAGVKEGGLEENEKKVMKEIVGLGGNVIFRRVASQDLDVEGASKWYICAGKGLASAVEGWAAEKGVQVVGESFAY
ncbi:MAG: hypothetical protein MMC23_010186 [Stictis urceolatum]|nr:hypothetical protein [Stictis urceolata]